MSPPESAGSSTKQRCSQCYCLEQRCKMSLWQCWPGWRGFTSGPCTEWYISTTLCGPPEVGSTQHQRICSRKQGSIGWSTTSRCVVILSHRTSCTGQFSMSVGGEGEDEGPGPASFGGTNRWDWMEQGERRRPNRISGEAKRFCCSFRRRFRGDSRRLGGEKSVGKLHGGS